MVLQGMAVELAKAAGMTHTASRRLVRMATHLEHAGGTCVGVEFIARGFGMHMQPAVFLSVLLVVFVALVSTAEGGE